MENNKNGRERQLYRTIIGIFIIVVILQVFILILVIFGGEIPKLSGEWDWGSLIGGVFGGVATLIAFIITINHNRKQLEYIMQRDREKDRKIIEPNITCKIEYLNDKDIITDSSFYDKIIYLNYIVDLNDKPDKIDSKKQVSKLILKSDGLESAININLKIKNKNNKRWRSVQKFSLSKNEIIKFIIKGKKQDAYDLRLEYDDCDSEGYHYTQDWLMHVFEKDKRFFVTPNIHPRPKIHMLKGKVRQHSK